MIKTTMDKHEQIKQVVNSNKKIHAFSRVTFTLNGDMLTFRVGEDTIREDSESDKISHILYYSDDDIIRIVTKETPDLIYKVDEFSALPYNQG